MMRSNRYDIFLLSLKRWDDGEGKDDEEGADGGNNNKERHAVKDLKEDSYNHKTDSTGEANCNASNEEEQLQGN